MCFFVVFIPWFVWWCGLFTKLSSIRVSVFCTTDPFLHTHVCRSAMYMPKMSTWHSLWVAFVFMPWTHILMFNESIPRRAPCDWVGFMDQPWDPWVHLQRFCSPNDDVNKGQLLSGVCPTWILVGCGHATKNEWTFKSSSFLCSFRISPTKKTVSIAS